MNIKLFATLKDRAGQRSIDVPLTEATRVDALIEQVGRSHPALADALPSCVVAVNRQFAEPETTVNVGDEVALFPPVSGG